MYRVLQKQLEAETDKITVLLGARQVGKTTLLKNTYPKAIYINLEKSNYIDIFNSRDLDSIQRIIDLENKIGKSDVLILDEVQRLSSPGLVTKLIYDEVKNIKLIISGSSALEIGNKAQESLAGRKRTLKLFPLTFGEWLVQKELVEASKQEKKINFDLKNGSKYVDELEEIMCFGTYPRVMDEENIQEYLMEMVDSAILKDVFYLNLTKNTRDLVALLKLLAYQIGQLVNVTDLANRIGVSRQTVTNYMEILKKIYIVFSLPPYTHKRRDEVGKMEKIYFWDLGIRNAIINDFSPVYLRNDYGSIFENLVVSEVAKINYYYQARYQMYYWRTKWGSEVDIVLNKDNKNIAIEVKTRKGKMTKTFGATYEGSKELVVTRENVESLLL